MRNLRNAYLVTGLFFLALSSNASADWAKFGSDKNAVFYVDPDTVAKNSGIVSLWILKDFYQVEVGPSREKFRSAKIYYEFKCDERMARQAYLTRHFAPMGGAGSLSSDARIYSWMPIAPGAEQTKLFEFACKRAESAIQPSN